MLAHNYELHTTQIVVVIVTVLSVTSVRLTIQYNIVSKCHNIVIAAGMFHEAKRTHSHIHANY